MFIQGQPHEGAAPGGLGYFWIWDFLKLLTNLFSCFYTFISFKKKKNFRGKHLHYRYVNPICGMLVSFPGFRPDLLWQSGNEVGPSQESQSTGKNRTCIETYSLQAKPHKTTSKYIWCSSDSELEVIDNMGQVPWVPILSITRDTAGLCQKRFVHEIRFATRFTTHSKK